MSGRERTATAFDRWLLAVAIVVLDVAVVVIPVTALVVAALIVTRPAWLRRWIDDLYESPPPTSQRK